MSNFEEQLLSIIEERESALFEIERILFTQRYKLSQKHLSLLAIQSIPMAYSIWENFVQKSFQMYVNELNSMGMNISDLSNDIFIFHMENTFKQLKEYPDKDGKKIKFYVGLQKFFTNMITPLYSSIKTENNVGFDVLNKLLKNFCLTPFDKVWGNYVHPNQNLEEALTTFLRYRNSVSHGGDISSEEKVTKEVYVKYKTLVVDLMYEIQVRMVDGLARKTYLKITHNNGNESS